jgi:hypothetical protein
MPTKLPERSLSPREDAVPVRFLLGTLAVVTTAIVLSVALLPPAPAPGSDSGLNQAEQQVAIGFPP